MFEPAAHTRGTFLASLAALPLAGLAPSIDWSFPGVVAAWAQRLSDDAPFVRYHDGIVFPAASIIKLAIDLAVARRAERLHDSWETRVPLAAREIVSGSDTFGSAHGGQRATLEALARAMISQSDNTAANVLADWCGFDAVNALVREAGLERTSLRRHFMDFAARAAGIDNTTTARDMATLVRGIALGTRHGFAGVAPADCRRVVRSMLAQEDRETIPAGISRQTRIANKTGELVDVRHDVAIVNEGRADAYVMVLLSKQLRNRPLAFRRLRQIASAIDAVSRART